MRLRQLALAREVFPEIGDQKRTVGTFEEPAARWQGSSRSASTTSAPALASARARSTVRAARYRTHREVAVAVAEQRAGQAAALRARGAEDGDDGLGHAALWSGRPGRTWEAHVKDWMTVLLLTRT